MFERTAHAGTIGLDTQKRGGKRTAKAHARNFEHRYLVTHFLSNPNTIQSQLLNISITTASLDVGASLA